MLFFHLRSHVHVVECSVHGAPAPGGGGYEEGLPAHSRPFRSFASFPRRVGRFLKVRDSLTQLVDFHDSFRNFQCGLIDGGLLEARIEIVVQPFALPGSEEGVIIPSWK